MKQVCCRSSKRIAGRPALSRSGLKCRSTMFWVSRGVPFLVANTSPESSLALAFSPARCEISNLLISEMCAAEGVFEAILYAISESRRDAHRTPKRLNLCRDTNGAKEAGFGERLTSTGECCR